MSSFRTLRNQVVKVGASGLGSQAVTFLSLPVISRLYTPDAYGGWALFLSYGLVIGSIATLRYELAVVLPRTDRQAAVVLAAGVAASLAFAILTVPLLPLAAALLFSGEGSQSRAAASVLWTLPLLVLAIAGYQLARAWCTRRAAFGTYSLGQFLMPTLTAGGQIAMALIGVSSAKGLIAGSLLGYGVAALVMWSQVLRRNAGVIIGGFRLSRLLPVACRYRNYPLYMTPYTLLSTVRDRGIYFLLGAFASDAATGHYALAQRFTNIPNSLVSGAVRPVFFQFAARRPLETLGPMVAAIIAALLLLTVPNLVVFVFHAEAIVTLLFGAQWVDAAPFAMLLAVPALPLLLGNWMDRTLDVLNRQRLAFVMETIFSLSVVVALALGLWLSGEPMIAVTAQAAVMTLYFTGWIVVVFRVANFGQALLVRLLALAAGLGVGSAGLLLLVQAALPGGVALAAFYAAYVSVVGLAYRRYGGQLAGLVNAAS